MPAGKAAGHAGKSGGEPPSRHPPPRVNEGCGKGGAWEGSRGVKEGLRLLSHHYDLRQTFRQFVKIGASLWSAIIKTEYKYERTDDNIKEELNMGKQYTKENQPRALKLTKESGKPD